MESTAGREVDDSGRSVGSVKVEGTPVLRHRRVGSAAGAIPKDLDHSQFRFGMPDTATVFAEKAGVIGLIMSILVWVNSY